MRMKKEKNNSWENLQGYRYAHRGLFHQPLSASRKPAISMEETSPSRSRPPQWAEDIARWKSEGKCIAPENSMRAFRAAASHGFGSELDVHLTKDGVLAVFHDDNLLRMTGYDGKIEEMTWEELSALRLLGTSCRIPLLEEVLSLYTSDHAVSGNRGRHLPLIIELKCEGNVRALCLRVMEMIDRYPELNYCIESFDPRAVLWFRFHRPDVIRGQLTENFMRSKSAVRQWGHVMTFGMWCDVPGLLSRPDFIACKYRDRRNVFLRLRYRLGAKQVNWVIRDPEEMKTVDREGGLSIFERFIPDPE